MTRAKWFLVGLLGFCIPALMAPSGGFPFFARFGAIAIGKPVIINPAAARFDMKAPTAAGFAQIGIQDTTTGSSGICMSDTAAVCGAGVPAHALNIQNGANGLYFNGVPNVPHAAVVSLTNAGCTVSNQTGFSTTCTRTGVGTFSFPFSINYTSFAACSATEGAGAGGLLIASNVTASTSGISMALTTTGGAPTDPTAAENWALICSGI